jgi:SAM-dependent methyltransferase
MQEFARILKPGGIVVVHAHSPLDPLEKPADLLLMLRSLFWRPAGLERGDWYYLHGSSLGYSYIHEFKAKEFRNLFRSVGLKVVKEFYLNLKQDRLIHDMFSFASGGFIFVGQKI